MDPAKYPWHQTLAHVPIPVSSATVHDLVERMNAARVDRAVLVQPSVYGYDNKYLFDAIAAYPGRFAAVCLVDARSPEGPSRLRDLREDRGCRGVRLNLIAESDASWVTETVLDPFWVAAASTGAQASIQIRHEQAPIIATLAARHPDVQFVVDYLGPTAFHDPAAVAMVECLAAQPNIAYKLLALGTDSHEGWPFRDLWPLYRACLDAFGPERIAYGTDYPHCLRVGRYEESIRWLQELPFLDADAAHVITEVTPERLWFRAEGGQ